MKIKCPKCKQKYEVKPYEIRNDELCPSCIPMLPNDTPVPPKALQPECDLKKKRKYYLTFFLFAFFTMLVSGGPGGLNSFALLYPFFWVIFLCYFLPTVKKVRGYSKGKMVVMCIGLFVPIVSLIIFLIVDRSICEEVRKREHPELVGN